MGGYIGAGQKPIALFDAYTKAQSNGLFPDKTSVTPQDFTAMPSVGGDPVVESGSNADGEWTRFSDGTQICSNYSASVADFLTNSPSGSIFQSAGLRTLTYPIAFITRAAVADCSYFNNSGPSRGWLGQDASTTANVSFVVFSSGSGGGVSPRYRAIGRWK